MGVSTDGQICYGIKFDEGMEFPWDSDLWDHDIDEWWLMHVLGYEREFELFDDDGNWIEDAEPDQEVWNKYNNHKMDFLEKSPCIPVDLVNYCSRTVPMYIIALKGTTFNANRGWPKVFDPNSLKVLPDYKELLLRFCEDYGIKFSTQPQWYLSSFYEN